MTISASRMSTGDEVWPVAALVGLPEMGSGSCDSWANFNLHVLDADPCTLDCQMTGWKPQVATRRGTWVPEGSPPFYTIATD
jgi:hypothetical protein